MKLYAARTLLIVISLGMLSGSSVFAGESCECPAPPGGSVQCQGEQNAHCDVKDGACITSCTGVATGAVTKIDMSKPVKSFSVKGETFTVTDFTKLKGFNGKPISLNELKGGENVRVWYKVFDGKVEASNVVVGIPKDVARDERRDKWSDKGKEKGKPPA